MTKTARRRRLQSNGTNGCPYCGAEEEFGIEVDYGDIEPVEPGGFEQQCRCLTCHRKWVDVFTLAEVRELVS